MYRGVYMNMYMQIYIPVPVYILICMRTLTRARARAHTHTHTHTPTHLPTHPHTQEDLVSVLSVLLTALVIEARVASPSALAVPTSDWGGGGGGSWGDPAGECKHGSGVVTGNTGTVGCGYFVCLCGNGTLALNMV